MPTQQNISAATSRDTRGNATSWCTATVTLQLGAPAWAARFQRFRGAML